jgi:hypothetical protein
MMRIPSWRDVLVVLVGLVAAAGLGWWLRPEVGPRPVSPRSSQAPSAPHGTPMPRAPVPSTPAEPVASSPPAPKAEPAVPPPLTLEQVQFRLSVLDERLEVAQARFERVSPCLEDDEVDHMGDSLSLCRRQSQSLHRLLERLDLEAHLDRAAESLNAFYVLIDSVEVLLDVWEAQEGCP